MSQALYRKWRPSRWQEVVGQQHVVQSLHNAVAADRVGHAYLFAGPRGTGKTTVARILAKAVNCLAEKPADRPCDECAHCQSVNSGTFLDLIEIDAASNTSVEDVRDLRDKINFSPNQGRYKVYIIDEVHMLSTAAFNALLKTLEEPPPHAIFVLATTEVHRIPATVLSRCQRHEFRRIPVKETVAHLEQVASAESLKVEKDALLLVARQATGSLRDAISLLDQLSAMSKKITLDMAQTILGTATSQAVLDLIDALLAIDGSAGLDLIQRTLDSGSDPQQFSRQIVDYLRNVMLVRMGNADQVDAPTEVRQHMAEHAQSLSESDLLSLVRVFNQAATVKSSTWQPSLPLELAFLEALVGPAQEKAEPQKTYAAVNETKKAASPEVKKAAKEKAPLQENNTDEGAGIVLDQSVWNQIKTLVKEQSSVTNGLLNSCRSVELRQSVLYLGFSSEVLCKKMSQEEHAILVSRICQQELGETIEVECIVCTSGKGSLPQDVDASGMVATGMHLGGEIVDVNDLKKGKKD
jgi:DNA polymerase-3 subunit gamma/tau